MNDLRALLAIALWLISAYLIYDLVVEGFDWVVMLASVSGFWLAHVVWPSGHGHEDHWYDVFELIIDLPFKAIAKMLRAIRFWDDAL